MVVEGPAGVTPMVTSAGRVPEALYVEVYGLSPAAKVMVVVKVGAADGL